jgi:hypothetical protein
MVGLGNLRLFKRIEVSHYLIHPGFDLGLRQPAVLNHRTLAPIRRFTSGKLYYIPFLTEINTIAG